MTVSMIIVILVLITISIWNNSNMLEIIDLNLYSDLDVPNEPPERNMKFFNHQI